MALLYSNVMSLLRRDPHLVTLLLIVASVFPLLFVVAAPPQSDVFLYHQAAENLMAGEVPYRDRELGYPPYAISIFLIPWLSAFGGSGSDVARYQFAFAVLALLADSILKFFLLVEGSKHQDRLLGLLPLALYCLSVPFIRFFYLQRYDIFPSFLVIGALCCFARGWVGWSGAFLMIGAGMKLYPALLAPALWSLAFKRERGMRIMAGSGLALIPLAVSSFFFPWWQFLAGHSQRGIQVESLYASLVWLAYLAGVTDATWSAPVGGFIEVTGPAAHAMVPWAKSLLLAATLASIAFSAWVGSRCSRFTIYQVARLMLVPLLSFVAFNVVLSPQYMIWLLPLAAVGLLGGSAWPMVMIAIATAVTPIFYPSREYMTGLNPGQTIALACRNVSLVIVWLVLIREFWQMARRSRKAP